MAHRAIPPLLARLILLALLALLLFHLSGRYVPWSSGAFDLRWAVAVAVAPLLLGVFLLSPGPVIRAVRLALTSPAEGAADPPRQAAAFTLRLLGDLSWVTGLVALGTGGSAAFATAARTGELTHLTVVLACGPLVVWPLLGLMLKLLVYDPLASRLEGDDPAPAGHAPPGAGQE